jgi:hypothetical protein
MAKTILKIDQSRSLTRINMKHHYFIVLYLCNGRNKTNKRPNKTNKIKEINELEIKWTTKYLGTHNHKELSRVE